MTTTTMTITTDEKLDQILDQQERILEQQEEIIDLLLENGLSKGGYSMGSSFGFDEED